MDTAALDTCTLATDGPVSVEVRYKDGLVSLVPTTSMSHEEPDHAKCSTCSGAADHSAKTDSIVDSSIVVSEYVCVIVEKEKKSWTLLFVLASSDIPWDWPPS